MFGDGSLYKRHTKTCAELGKKREERTDTCECPWWMSYRANGRGYSESCSTSNKTVAKARLKAKIREINSGKFVEPSVQKITVDELVEDLKAWYRAGLSPRTFNPERFLADVDSRWTLHLQPFFGGRKANTVTALVMREYRNKRLAEKASNVTVNREIQVLRKAYRLAASSEPPKIQRLPKFEFAKEDNARKVSFDTDTKAKILFAASKEGLWAKVWLLLAFEFGLRKSDLRRLKVGQFDLVAGFLRQTISKTRETVQLSLRSDLLLLIRELAHGKCPDEGLFPVQDFRYAWKRICKAAGITAGKKDGFVLHDARRTTTQELVSSGAAARDIIAVLGWKSPAMLHRYGYAEAGSIKTALERRAAHQQSLIAEGQA